MKEPLPENYKPNNSHSSHREKDIGVLTNQNGDTSLNMQVFKYKKSHVLIMGLNQSENKGCSRYASIKLKNKIHKDQAVL